MLIRIIKDWALLFAVVIGSLGYQLFYVLIPIIPYTLFVMLFITYSKVSIRELNPKPIHWAMLFVQLLIGVTAYGVIYPFDRVLAQGIMIVGIAPPATAASVVCAMLGGSISSMVTFTFLSNIAVAFAVPIVLSIFGIGGDLEFWHSFKEIIFHVTPVILLPMIFAQLILYYLPKWNDRIRRMHNITFYIWMSAIIIVMARTTKTIVEEDESKRLMLLCIGVGSSIFVFFQFAVGKLLGKFFGDPIVGGQGIGQKNTVFAIWAAQTYMDPLASLIPALAVVWQNVFNSLQLWYFNHKKRKINHEN